MIGYLDAILERKPVGQRVAVIGAGGIGFDVSEYITHDGQSTSLDREAFWKEWGIDLGLSARGGIAGIQPAPHAQAAGLSAAAQKSRLVTAWARPPAGFTVPA